MSRLTPDLLRRIFGPHPAPGEPPPALVPAGVLLPVFFTNGEPHLLFTQRTMLVKDHRGQISFPGGVRDPEDADLRATAVRESAEEIGLNPAAVEVCGSFKPVTTVTGYWVAPFVSLIPYPYDFVLNQREVARLLTFPVAGFLAPQAWQTGPYTYQGQTRLVCCWRQGDITIWGATARLLLNFLACLGEHPLPPDTGGRCEFEEG
jgi:8-oxo-dGTP pyrophosphatase MutT (NUDIX family)